MEQINMNEPGFDPEDWIIPLEGPFCHMNIPSVERVLKIHDKIRADLLEQMDVLANKLAAIADEMETLNPECRKEWVALHGHEVRALADEFKGLEEGWNLNFKDARAAIIAWGLKYKDYLGITEEQIIIDIAAATQAFKKQ